MSTLSPDFVPGPRCGGNADGTADAHDGAYQFPALATGQVIDLTAWGREYVRITWIPAAATDELIYGFFATEELADTGFDVTTDSSGDPATIVKTAPDMLAAGYVDTGVPPNRLFLRIEPSAGSGRAIVRSSSIDVAWG